MIVKNMSRDEIINEFIKDINYFTFRVDSPKLYKSSKIKQLKGIDTWIKWKSPRYNVYNIKYFSKQGYHIFIYKNGLMYHTILGGVPTIRTKHFFERYNERFLKGNLSIINIIKLFLDNEMIKDITNLKTVNENVLGLECYSTNGVHLGYSLKGIFLFNTFVSINMYHKCQKNTEFKINIFGPEINNLISKL